MSEEWKGKEFSLFLLFTFNSSEPSAFSLQPSVFSLQSSAFKPTNASAATGSAPRIMTGLMSISAISGCRSAIVPNA